MRFAGGGGSGGDSTSNALRSFYAKYGRTICLVIGIVLGMLITKLLFSYPLTSSALATTDASGAVVDSAPKVSTSESSIAVGNIVDCGSQNSGDINTEEEKKFLTTFRSCLRKDCFDNTVEVKGRGEQLRIGLLIPDLAGSKPLLGMLATAGVLSKKSVVVIPDSNVPAYGYGKNHGWSKIIRIAQDVVPTSYSILKAKYPTKDDVVSDLYEAQLRQLMRWHCRLSHVAAHTSMLTVFVEDFLARPVAELDRIVSFIGQKVSRDDLVRATDAHLSDLQQQWALTAAPLQIKQKAARVMASEMSSTDNLTRWPCKLFSRDLGLRDDDMLQMLPLPVYTLLANCSEPYVKCSVPFDINAHNEYLESIDR